MTPRSGSTNQRLVISLAGDYKGAVMAWQIPTALAAKLAHPGPMQPMQPMQLSLCAMVRAAHGKTAVRLLVLQVQSGLLLASFSINLHFNRPISVIPEGNPGLACLHLVTGTTGIPLGPIIWDHVWH